MNYQVKIAFGHKARSGKDDACSHLLTQSSGSIVRFADPVYSISYYLQGCLGEETHKNPSLLQSIGEGLRDLYDPDIWVKIAEKKIRSDEASPMLLNPDLRKVNEALMLQLFGFILVRVDRKDRIIDRDPNHPSETALDNWTYDYIIVNNGTLEQFHEKIDKLYKIVTSGEVQRGKMIIIE